MAVTSCQELNFGRGLATGAAVERGSRALARESRASTMEFIKPYGITRDTIYSEGDRVNPVENGSMEVREHARRTHLACTGRCCSRPA